MSNPKIDPRARLRHDLRTPPHQIIGYAELLEDEVRDAGQEKYVADLAKIRDAARKALANGQPRCAHGAGRPASRASLLT